MEGQKLFTPNAERTFSRKVTFKIPTDSGADTVATLKTRFRSKSQDELENLQEELTDSGMYNEVVVGVEGVGDGNGEELDHVKAKDVMAGEPSFVFEAMMEFYDAVKGGNFKAKTSKKRRGTG